MLKTLHRYLGLTLALLWFVQVGTGVLVVFRWELDDASVYGPRVRVDPAALGARISAIKRGGGRVSSMWVTGPDASRFDIYYVPASQTERVMRVDGGGNILRDGPSDALLCGGGLFNTLTRLHESLFAGESGSWLIGLSSLVLLSNLIMGLKLAWPRRGGWRALVRRPRGPGPARRYGWHRIIGLWIALPAIVVVSAGVLLVFKDGVQQALARLLARGEPPSVVAGSAPAFAAHAPASTNSAAPPGSPDAGYALSRALAQYPGGALSALLMPGEGHPWFEVRVRRPGDLPRIWGTTTLLLRVADGSHVEQPEDSAARAHRLADLIYPIHTAQFAGLPGRSLLLLTGLGVLVMIGFGLGLWSSRRARRIPRRNEVAHEAVAG